MKFKVKHYEDGKPVIEESLEHSEIVRQKLHDRFLVDENVAYYDELKMADGRMSFTLKDRANKIIIQYTEQ